MHLLKSAPHDLEVADTACSGGLPPLGFDAPVVCKSESNEIKMSFAALLNENYCNVQLFIFK